MNTNRTEQADQGKDLAKREPEQVQLQKASTGGGLNMFDPDVAERVYKMAHYLAKSDLLPTAFRGKTENCFIAIQLAHRLAIDPFMLMQSMYVVHGKPGFEAKLVIALVNERGPFDGPIQWEYAGEGKERSCTAYATHAHTHKRCEATVTWRMVEAEGWNKKEGSKWMTIPDQMFAYRSATFLARLYCPEVLMGVPTVDELDDMDGNVRIVSADVIGEESRTERLAERLTAEQEASEPVAADPDTVAEAVGDAPDPSTAAKKAQVKATLEQAAAPPANVDPETGEERAPATAGAESLI